MIQKAKMNYYQNKAKTLSTHDPARWYKAIYALSGTNTQQNGATEDSMSKEEAFDVAEKLQRSFIAPWKNINTTAGPQSD